MTHVAIGFRRTNKLNQPSHWGLQPWEMYGHSVATAMFLCLYLTTTARPDTETHLELGRQSYDQSHGGNLVEDGEGGMQKDRLHHLPQDLLTHIRYHPHYEDLVKTFRDEGHVLYLSDGILNEGCQIVLSHWWCPAKGFVNRSGYAEPLRSNDIGETIK
ncbi:hypothetical protein C8J56DRAFT_892013 [Mycena floridula]|nr:hypothetical protein C8J56DRAFT_892013 [Mycena floridula]